jgi:RHS repeat-associated protein
MSISFYSYKLMAFVRLHGHCFAALAFAGALLASPQAAKAQQSSLYIGGNCIQFDPNGTSDCSPKPNKVSDWQWSVGDVVGYASGQGNTEQGAISDYIAKYTAAYGTASTFCGISVKSITEPVLEYSDGFDFGKFVTSKNRAGYYGAGVVTMQVCSYDQAANQYNYYDLQLYSSGSRQAGCQAPYSESPTYVYTYDVNAGSYTYLTYVCTKPLQLPNAKLKVSAPMCSASGSDTDDGAITPFPIVPATGEKRLDEIDQADPSAHPLHWQRHYRSQPSAQLLNTANFGNNWLHNHAYSASYKPATAFALVQRDPNTGYNLPNQPTTGWGNETFFINRLEINLPDGSQQIFRSNYNSPSVFTSQAHAGKVQVLYTNNVISGFTYKDEADSTFTFDATGRLLTRAQRNGHTLSYAYNSAGQLASITNQFGRSLQIAHTSGRISQVNLPGGSTVRYGYSATGQLNQVLYADNASKTYHYENINPALLTGITDENAKRLATYTYDAQGRAISSQHAGGANRYQIAYPASDELDPNTGITLNATRVTDPLGKIRSFHYSFNKGHLSVAKSDAPAGNGMRSAASRTQQADGLLSSETDFNNIGNVYTGYYWYWDPERRLPTYVPNDAGYGYWKYTGIQWHPDFRLPTYYFDYQTGSGMSVEFEYDTQGNILKRILNRNYGDNSERTWLYTWGTGANAGLMTSQTDPKGQQWQYAYDSAGNLTSSTNPLGHETRYTYNSAGRLATTTEPNGLVTSLQYDARGRITSSTRGSNLAASARQITSYAYTPSGQLANASLPDGTQLAYSYDDAQRLIAVADNRGARITYTLDAMGNRLREDFKDAAGQTLLTASRLVNDINRVAAMSGAASQTSNMAYDANGDLISQANPLGHTTQYTRDASRRVASETFADGANTSLQYYANGAPYYFIDANGVTTYYTQNSHGEPNYESIEGTYATTEYDKAGNILLATNLYFKGSPNTYQYDTANRLTQINYAGLTRHYDGTPIASQTHTFTYDTAQKGYLTSFTDASGQTTYTRDAFGRILTKTQLVNDNPANPSSYKITYSYNSAGQLAQLIYPSGLRVIYQRNAQGQITGIQTKTSASATTANLITGLQHNALQQPTAWAWAHCTAAANALGPCASARRSYDTDARITATELASYTYDANSRIIAISQQLAAQRSVSTTSGTATITTTQLYPITLSWAIGYDNRDRLSYFNRTDNSASTAYTYDANSNRTSAVVRTAQDSNLDGNITSTDTRKTITQNHIYYANSNRLQGFGQLTSSFSGTRTTNASITVTHTLDSAGNLISDGLRTFEYDATERLSKVTLGSTFVGTDTIAGNELAAHTYLHNAAGQRVFKSEPRTELTTPDSTTLGTGFVSWLQTHFSWLWSAAQTNATLGDAYIYADAPTDASAYASGTSAGLPSWALLGEYGNGAASSTGRTEYIWLPTGEGNAIPVGLYRSGKFLAVHTDHLGTPRKMVDNANQTVWQWPYSAFGDNAPTGILKPTTSAPAAFVSLPAQAGSGTTTASLLALSSPTQINNLRMPGQYFDKESNLHYNTYRTYQPAQGRYTQNDPIGLQGGWNRMIYAYSDGINGYDPLGLDVCLLTTRNRVGIGSHSALYISSPKPVIYDPSGSYAFSKTGEEFAYGPLADINKFKDFHKKLDGHTTDVSCRKTSPEEDKKIYEKALEQDQGYGPVCSRRISDVLSGSPSFPGVSPGTWFPGNLARQFK